MAPRTVPAQRWETEGKTRRAAVRRKVGYESCKKSPKFVFCSGGRCDMSFVILYIWFWAGSGTGSDISPLLWRSSLVDAYWCLGKPEPAGEYYWLLVAICFLTLSSACNCRGRSQYFLPRHFQLRGGQQDHCWDHYLQLQGRCLVE